jgi:hypothetical protein
MVAPFFIDDEERARRLNLLEDADSQTYPNYEASEASSYFENNSIDNKTWNEISFYKRKIKELPRGFMINLRLIDYSDLLEKYQKAMDIVISKQDAYCIWVEAGPYKIPSWIWSNKHLNKYKQFNKCKFTNAVSFEYYHDISTCQIDLFGFIEYWSKKFKHEGIGFDDLPIRYICDESRCDMINIWFNDSLHQALIKFRAQFFDTINYNAVHFNCLPQSYLKMKLFQRAKELFYESIRYDIKEGKFIVFDLFLTYSESKRKSVNNVASKLNKILLKRPMKCVKIFDSSNPSSEDFIWHSISGRMKCVSPEYNYLLTNLVDLFSLKLDSINIDDFSLFKNQKMHSKDFMVMHDARITEDEFREFKLHMAERMSKGVGLSWKQLQFRNTKDMIKTLNKLRNVWSVSVISMKNKIALQKSAPHEYYFDKMDIKEYSLELGKVFIEIKMLDSINKQDNDEQDNILKDHQKYWEAYNLRNKLSIPKPKGIVLKSISELQLFHMLSVQRDEDQVFPSMKKCETKSFPEVSKHLNVLFCK